MGRINSPAFRFTRSKAARTTPEAAGGRPHRTQPGGDGLTTDSLFLAVGYANSLMGIRHPDGPESVAC
jgi:hypothetical protein